MKKYLIAASSAALVFSLAAAVILPTFAGKNGQAGTSNVAHLYLYEKNVLGDWSIVEGGAWGKMKYNLSAPTFDFVFNGHNLNPDTDYSLIYYADGWPGNHPGALLASGTSNDGGDIHLAGPNELNIDLPDPADANYPGGAKIWLVLSSNYNAATNSLTAWNPTQWLFESELINYDDTDVP